MNARHRVADALMHRYLEEVLRRQRGEGSGVRSLVLVLSGYVTACCGVTPSSTKGGDVKCPECHRAGDECVLRSWHGAKSLGGGNRSWRHMHVSETRSIDRDREDRRLVRETDRWLWLRRLIEPRPRSVPERVWIRALAAWGLVLLEGGVFAGTLEEQARFQKLAGYGPVTTWTHRLDVRLARSVVARRAIRGRRAA